MAKQKAKGEALHEREILTSELGAIVGKTPQWIRQLTREGVLKQVDRGKYILGESVQAYIKCIVCVKNRQLYPIISKTENSVQ
jgi:hypothetical protein